MVNQPPSPFCNSSRVNTFASVVKTGLVRLPRFAAELFPQLCYADMLTVSTVSSTFALVCLAGLPRFRLTATLSPTGLSACTLGNSTLVCFVLQAGTNRMTTSAESRWYKQRSLLTQRWISIYKTTESAQLLCHPGSRDRSISVVCTARGKSKSQNTGFPFFYQFITKPSTYTSIGIRTEILYEINPVISSTM